MNTVNQLKTIKNKTAAKVEAELADLGPAWAAECCPAHIDGEAVQGPETGAKTTPAKQG